MKTKKQRYWEVWDYGLAEAASRLAAERCKKCGTEAWHAHSENALIGFELSKHTCYGCAHLEEVEDKKSDKDKKEFGVTEQVKAVHVDWELGSTDPLPTRHEWIEEMIAKQK